MSSTVATLADQDANGQIINPWHFFGQPGWVTAHQFMVNPNSLKISEQEILDAMELAMPTLHDHRNEFPTAYPADIKNINSTAFPTTGLSPLSARFKNAAPSSAMDAEPRGRTSMRLSKGKGRIILSPPPTEASPSSPTRLRHISSKPPPESEDEDTESVPLPPKARCIRSCTPGPASRPVSLSGIDAASEGLPTEPLIPDVSALRLSRSPSPSQHAKSPSGDVEMLNVPQSRTYGSATLERLSDGHIRRMESIDLSLSLFSSITHLGLRDEVEGIFDNFPGFSWSSLALLPALTHLATRDLNVVVPTGLCTSCNKLQVLVILYGDGPHFHSLPSFDHARLAHIFLPDDDYRADWLAGTREGAGLLGLC
ncbi:hypothetical protein DFH07DRAFT_989129 [Mycena maculata]|uniref:Uncharacterized protein n=1 Tax=Mycena maculata TaxID=230809 RepID=A0AAD7I4U1_9AGAR|nr:hypothetical protein DFH07DRAFT_989129 [Mycena maculata]